MGLRLPQMAFVGGEVSPVVFARADLEKIALCLKTCKNFYPTRWGSVVNRPGAQFIGEVKDSSDITRLMPFSFSTTQTYVNELGDQVLRPVMNQGQVLESATNITACTSASPGVFTATSHGLSVGNHVYIAGITGLAASGVSQINGRVMVVGTVPTGDTFTLTDLFGSAFNTASLSAYSAGGTVSRLYQQTSPYASADLFALSFTQKADTAYLAHRSYAPRSLTRSGHANWTFASLTFASAQAAPTNPAVNEAPASGATVRQYKVTAFDEDTGQESLPTTAVSATNDLTVSGNLNTISWTAASGADRYHVYCDSGTGIFGYIGGSQTTSFVDGTNGPISEDLGDTPPSNRNPFGSSDNYPGVVDFHEGRLIWGRTNNTPGGVWMSQSNKHTNMNVSVPAKGDDAITLQFSPGVHPVTGFASLAKLLVFTKEGEWVVDGGGVTTYLTPASLVTRQHSARGSAELRPLTVNDIALFIQRQGGRIIAYGYSFEKDSYAGNELSILAPHLFDGHTIVDWCYQQDPHSIVWLVRDDGVLLSLTFVPEQNVYALAKHYLGGTFGSGASATGYGVVESCACIEGSAEDEVYLIVKRTINSVTKRYIEMLAPRWNGDSDDLEDAFFVDSGKTVTNSPASATVSGLWHLEGQSVGGLADGAVFTGKTVSGGQITLDAAASTIQVGLLYESDIETLPVMQGTQAGAPQGRRKASNPVVLKLRHTLGLKVGMGSHPSNAKELLQGHVDGWDGSSPINGDTRPIPLEGGWSMDATTLVRQSKPLPAEILAIYQDVTAGGS